MPGTHTFFTLVTALLLLVACSTPRHPAVSLPDTRSRTDKLFAATGSSAVPFTLKTSPFTLFGLRNRTMKCRGETMHLYIEGDGLSWKSRDTPSDDPTPLDPLVGRLYRLDPSVCKVYLARPCMYLHDPVCRQSDWTDARFSSRVVGSYQQALNRLKSRYGNRNFTLIGYSGGGTVAALLAARRRDVKRLVTVAGNLDTETWTALHRIAPLRGSLNPADESGALQNTPQTHLLGGRDRTVPAAVYDSYRRRFPQNAPIRSVNYPSNTHSSGWESAWRSHLSADSN